MVLTRSATQRGLEVLAIVARSGKYLPVGLTFGPVNGPDDFNFVVDRAYAPGRGRRLRFTKEWIAYVDDLTVRSGRVIDGRFYTDNEADQAIRDACSKGSVTTPQSAGAALEALGVRQQGTPGKRAKHDAAKADTNHPTRVSVSRVGFGLFGFGRVLGLVGVFLGGPSRWSPVMGLEACSYRPYTSACARVPVRYNEVQQVRSAREALGSRLLVCFPLGTPEPVGCAPFALDPSQGTRVQRYRLETSSRAACRSPALTFSASCLSVPRALLRSNWYRTSLLGTRGGPSTRVRFCCC